MCNMFLRIFLFTFGFAVVASRSEPFFKRDYTYVDQFDAFYKVHWKRDGGSFSSAFMTCDDEDSTIFYPKMEGELSIVKSLVQVQAMKDKHNATEIFVGVLNRPIINENDRPSEDGVGTCVTMDIYSGSYKLQDCSNYTDVGQLFICRKKVVVEACPTVDNGYEYIKNTGKCYKFHENKRRTWKKAMETCFNEGGHLAIVKNPVEAEIIRSKLSFYNIDYFVGFRKMESNSSDSNLYTIKGHKFDNTSYYIRWNHNVTFDTKDDCGVIYQSNGNLNTMTKNCDEPAPFLCEIPSKTYRWSAYKSPSRQIIDVKEIMMLAHNEIHDDGIDFQTHIEK